MSNNVDAQPIIARSLATAALLTVLAGCTAPAPWPAPASGSAWKESSSASCPEIAGTYANVADDSSSCTPLDRSACSSLTFYFFSAHVPEAAGVSNFPTPSDDWPAGTHVQIEQPTADVLRIVAVDNSNTEGTEILASKDLDRKRGEFECEGSAIRLRPRVQRDYQLWIGRRTNTEYLVISSDQDALIVQSTRHYDSYLLGLVGGTFREEQSSHRWERVK